MAVMPALWLSLAVSVVLTVMVNLVLFLFPGAARRLQDGLARPAARAAPDRNTDGASPGVRVLFPWKAMIVGSLVLTVVINLLILLFR
jgi:hypothetical protein